MHDEQFFTWPPSPQLAMAVFPYIRSVYYNMYKELVTPYETALNRQLLGLPAVEPPPAEGANQNGQGQRPNDRNAARNAARAQGGILGMLQTLIDALEQDDDDGDNAPQLDDFQIDFRGEEVEAEGEEEAGVMLEVIVEEVEMDEAQNAGDVAPAEPLGDEPAPVEAPQAPAADAQPAVPQPAPDNAPAAPDNAPAAPADPAAPVAPAAGDAPNHEAPQPPARRMSLGAILSHVSNTLVSALILPGVSFAAGEALRLVLPKEWTASPLRNPWMRSASVAGGRPGLFQQQWGRSLVGGCLYVVLRDVLRVYSKTRKVAALSNRRVKNVDRPRRKR